MVDLESQSPEPQIPFIILEQEIKDLQEDTENIIPLTQPSTSNHYTTPGLVEGLIDGWSNCSTISLTSNNSPIPWSSTNWEQNSGTTQNPDTIAQYIYYPEEDDVYPPPNYSPVVYEDSNPFELLNIPQAPFTSIDIEYSYFLPDMYDYPREE